MANKFYAAGEDRAARVNDLFATIARRYDLINDLQSFWLHRFWKRRLVGLAHPAAGESALDVCCGTGDVAFALARQGADVVGLDFSEAMLAMARARSDTQSPQSPTGAVAERVRKMGSTGDPPVPVGDSPTGRARRPPLKGPSLFGSGAIPVPPGESPGGTGQWPVLPKNEFPDTLSATRMGARPPQFIRGDAQALPFPAAQFDLVTVSYGLRNLARWQTGLREMWRVAKPGGRLLVLDFGKPNNALWRQLYFAYLRWCVPLFGKLLCGDAQTYAYILESLNHYPAQLRVAEEMRKISCRDVRLVQLLGGAMSINYATKA